MSAIIVAKGLATFVLPPSLANRSDGEARSAPYCYSVFLRHLSRLHAAGCSTYPQVVGEIGPGASIGVGLAALVAGASRYYGFDVKSYNAEPADIALFDDLVALFEARAGIPAGGRYAAVRPELKDHTFPHYILTARRLKQALAPARIADLRARLVAISTSGHSQRDDAPAQLVAPWFGAARSHGIAPASVDWIFSQAVMEHVDGIEGTYSACADWLKPGGVMSHQIDLKSHGTARAWNGHWAYSDFAWRLVRGRRGHLINRLPASAHRRAIEEAGFRIVEALPVVRDDGLGRQSLAPRFRDLEDADLRTAGAFILACKRPLGA